ncbi:hypothetical protein [Niameybacter massiliensis]|uniref:hypothetical protein n=1 Tax=Niameybacter massiliensis TaxID=1658108 RepID=UPI0006B5C4FD|nr:hypothetical protein [Niameybacter massiliensis]
MLLNLIIIIAADLGFEFLFEKLNQSKYEPFEKVQAKTRELESKKVWQYSSLAVAVLGTIYLCNFFAVNFFIVVILLGFILALINTIFESTFYDQRRNTLR